MSATAIASGVGCAPVMDSPGAGRVERRGDERSRAAAIALLRKCECEVEQLISPDAIETAVMDLFRRSGSDESFEMLVELAHDRLLRRVRARTRFSAERMEPEELLQDAFINIYRYPDRFDASRPGAFKAWSSTIVDNAVRRHVRRSLSGADVRLQPVELLAQEPDRYHKGPGAQAIETETYQNMAAAYNLILSFYLVAYQGLTERERFVLQMVEVKGMRYAELAGILELRPEALKMVVFRARKRTLERLAVMFASAGSSREGRVRGGSRARQFAAY